MTEPSRFELSLDALESSARIPHEDLVELVEQVSAPLADVRGEDPDRSWFAAGG